MLTPHDSSKNTDGDSDFLERNDHWALLPPDTSNSLHNERKGKPILVFFMPWIAEEDMPTTLISTCKNLIGHPPDWPGIKLAFVEKPSPGFVIQIVKGWEPANPAQERALFQKINWEIQRIERS